MGLFSKFMSSGPNAAPTSKKRVITINDLSRDVRQESITQLEAVVNAIQEAGMDEDDRVGILRYIGVPYFKLADSPTDDNFDFKSTSMFLIDWAYKSEYKDDLLRDTAHAIARYMGVNFNESDSGKKISETYFIL